MNNIENVLKERGNRYGEFKDFSEISQKLKDTIFLNLNLKTEPEYEEINNVILEGLEMICHKLARISNGDAYYLDSWRDLSAYAKLVCNELEKTDGTTDVKTKQVIKKNGRWVHELDLEPILDKVDKVINDKEPELREDEDEDELLSKEEVKKMNHENFAKTWNYIMEKTFDKKQKTSYKPKNWKEKCGDCKYCNHIVDNELDVDFYVCGNEDNIIINGEGLQEHQECEALWFLCNKKESVFK